MKKTLIALAAVAATGAAFAQSSVTLDGVVDLGVVKPIVGVTSAATTNGARLDATNGASQIRFRGTEDLGGGLKANFILAQRLSLESGGNDGTANGRPTFQGESTVGLSGAFGSVKLGRALTALQGPINATDPWGTYQQGSTAVLAAGYTTDPANNTDTAGLGRTDAIHYSSPNFSGFSASVGLGFKQQANPVTPQAKGLVSLYTSYAAGPLVVGVGYEQNRSDDEITFIHGIYDFGVVRLGAGVSTIDTAAATGVDRNAFNIMAIVPLGAFTIKAGYGVSENDATSVKLNKKLGLGVDYALSKRTRLYASYGNDKGAGTKAGLRTGYDFGVAHTF